MKRFYCTICNKVRRVRVLPFAHACSWHGASSHGSFIRSERRPPAFPTSRRFVAPKRVAVPVSKGKKKRSPSSAAE